MDEPEPEPVPVPVPAPMGAVQQPKPQAFARSGPSSILVSPRQKGNPILNSVRSVAWEYSDIPADYVLGATTCALFLSLKYHRLHPEYVYNRIRDLKGQYQLRILLVMVDIENHEESLRELSKTSLVNNVTVILAWSAQEAGRYLELFKTFEHAAPTTIRTQQSTKYSDTLVDFITVPRSINKTDAVGLVSNFGSIRTAVNATPEELGLMAGWGEKKVQRWCNAVREPFRLQKATKRGAASGNIQATPSQQLSAAASTGDDGQISNQDFLQDSLHGIEAEARMGNASSSTTPTSGAADAAKRPSRRLAEVPPAHASIDKEEGIEMPVDQITTDAANSSNKEEGAASASSTRKQNDDNMSEGIMAALNKLRKQ
ncbi:mating-type switching protein swi10 [Periconia macrospinosa]|uniref:Mating-type switching protein swi10 n=1 Tax=Periconia macrospinosa TaxID=97972 RepID=A0A2V1EGR6_9PLEO|nr:mating-type switching protein swi10 [Periconia macrospinosa]